MTDHRHRKMCGSYLVHKMKDTQDTTLCVIERGTFFSVAERLARGVKKVYYCPPNGEGFETAWRDSLGHNYPGVEAIRDFWPIKDEIDGFVFPDCRDWGLQLELESQGFPVWGSKRAEDLETMRGKWIDVAKDIGLPMPKTETIQGLENLRVYLQEHKDEKKYVKISRYRGDMETWCAEDWPVTRNKLDSLAAKWQGLQNLLVFYVQDDLDTNIEAGADSYFVAGAFPDELILGYEKKNQGYIGAVMLRSEMPPEIFKPNELIMPVLADFNYCNFFSTEVRVVDGEGHLLDPCCRCPTPAGEEQMEMLTNLPDIIWHGANGILEQPKWAAKYCGQIAVSWTGEKTGAKVLRVPEEIRPWVKLYACAYTDDAFHFSPQQDPDGLASVVGIGDTPEEVIEHLKQLRQSMSGQPVDMPVEPLADLIREIEEAKAMGIEFGAGHELPEPAVVLDK